MEALCTQYNNKNAGPHITIVTVIFGVPYTAIIGVGYGSLYTDISEVSRPLFGHSTSQV
jgi:hypothetical protein